MEAEPGRARRGEVLPPNDLHIESRMKYSVFVSQPLVISSHGREEALLLVRGLKTNSSQFRSFTEGTANEGCIWLRMCLSDSRHMQDPGFHPQHSYSRKELYGNFSIY